MTFAAVCILYSWQPSENCSSALLKRRWRYSGWIHIPWKGQIRLWVVKCAPQDGADILPFCCGMCNILCCYLLGQQHWFCAGGLLWSNNRVLAVGYFLSSTMTRNTAGSHCCQLPSLCTRFRLRAERRDSSDRTVFPCDRLLTWTVYLSHYVPVTSVIYQIFWGLCGSLSNSFSLFIFIWIPICLQNYLNDL